MTPARLSQGIVDPPLLSDRGSVVQDRVSPAEGEALPSLPLTMVQNQGVEGMKSLDIAYLCRDEMRWPSARARSSTDTMSARTNWAIRVTKATVNGTSTQCTSTPSITGES